MPSMQGHSPRLRQGHHSGMDTAETPLRTIVEGKPPSCCGDGTLRCFREALGTPHCCSHPSWLSLAPAEVLPAHGLGEEPKITGLPLTHERTQGDDGLWAQQVVTVQAQVCKPPENHSVPLTAAPRGEGTAGTGGDTEPPQDNTALTRVAQGVTRCQEGQGAPGGDAAALSLPETSTDRISCFSSALTPCHPARQELVCAG